MSPSTRPAMIWSRMFFWVHWSEQKLQVLASSRRDTRKSSNVSPSAEVAAFSGLVDLPLYVPFDGRDDFGS